MPLRELLIAMISDRPHEGAIEEFVAYCRTSAVVHLRRRRASGRLNLEHVPLRLEDLALDCVADLFSRDAEGRFIQLRAYLGGLDLQGMCGEEITAHMRRLIFAKVNQGIFRVYNELDPSLGKVIRNIKLSIQALGNFTVADRFGETCIAPAGCDPLEHRPPAEMSVLRRELRRRAGTRETIPAMLAHLSRSLRDQEEHCRLVPLVQVALVFRGLYPAAVDGESGQPEGEIAFTISDAVEVIGSACGRVKERCRAKYVGSGKVDADTLDCYFAVIEAALIRTVVHRDGADSGGYYDELAKLLPGLTREAYRAGHKSRVEYLGRLSQREALNDLKKHF